MEVLRDLIEGKCRENLWNQINASQGGPTFSHVFFVDDLMLLAKADRKNCGMSSLSGRVVTLESGAKTWVSFKYKQLSNLCYWCGCLDHDDKDYEVWIDSDGTLDLKKKKI